MLSKLLNLFKKEVINPEDRLPRIAVEDVLNDKQIERANIYYSKHRKHVNKIMSETNKAFEPSQPEDLVDPSIWKPEYWRWFFNL